MAFAAPVVMILVNVLIAGAQSPHSAPAELPSFEVASIRANHSGNAVELFEILPNGRIRITNFTLKAIIELAYGIKDDQLSQ